MRCLKESHLVKCLGHEAGYRQLQWFANEYRGSDFKMKEAAQLLLEDCEQKAA